ncbi:MAG: class IV adenylate cyclase [Anaerohalosphaeraceae bacterium]
MAHLNIEIKARCTEPEHIRRILRQQNARFVGIDTQTDTYFNIPEGRLKLRQGTIENALIYYRRPDQPGPRQADVWLYPCPNGGAMKDLLAAALGVRVEVVKRREIYFIENIKFHIDQVDGLGSFVEIEAIDSELSIGTEKLRAQCQMFLDLLGIRAEDMLERSYSDMLEQSTNLPANK